MAYSAFRSTPFSSIVPSAGGEANRLVTLNRNPQGVSNYGPLNASGPACAPGQVFS